MDASAKKTALRMIGYGIYVLGVEHEGERGAASVTWVSQASFQPPLIMMGVKKDGWVYGVLQKGRRFALSFLDTDQQDVAKAFFKSPRAEDGRFGEYAYFSEKTDSPILECALAFVEGEVRSSDETGDHAVVVAEVVNAGVRREGTPLLLRDMGVFYGG